MIETFRTLTVPDGATLAYRVKRGEAPRQVIVLIHGMASNMTRWSEFSEKTTLKKSWDLLRLDLRGKAGALVFAFPETLHPDQTANSNNEILNPKQISYLEIRYSKLTLIVMFAPVNSGVKDSELIR